MTVYVDNARIEWQGKFWCHLVADSLSELHSFAILLGLRRSWFQRNGSYPHYDITVECRERALLLGAFAGARVQIITCAKKMKSELLQEALAQERQLCLFL